MSTNTPDGDEPPQHVRAAFGVSDGQPRQLSGTSAWSCDGVVLKPAADREHAVWVANILSRIDAPELRIARPVRSTDGRTLIAGWQAYRHLDGAPQARPDELMLTAVKLHQATADLHEVPPLVSRGGIGATADRLAWDEQDAELDEHRGGRWFEVLAGARTQVSLPDQLVHGGLCGNVLFDDEGVPGIVDFIPYRRPAEWGVAVAAVDALVWGGAEAGLLRRWAHLPEWPQMLLRAMLFRLAWHALDTQADREDLDGLLTAAHEVSELL